MDTHPLGCHRSCWADRDRFDVIVLRLATGYSFEDAERLAGGHEASGTTVRSRRDEWIHAGIFDVLRDAGGR